MNLIGFCGLANSGKDTTANILMKYINNSKKMSLADSLKDITSILFGWDRDLLEGNTSESRLFREQKDSFWSEATGTNFTPRLALQKIGTDCFRKNICDNFWVLVLELRLQKLINTNETVFITDIRFPNEIEMIHKFGGKVYRIKRGDYPDWWKDAEVYNKSTKKDILPNSLQNIHFSERALAGLNLEDGIIENEDDLEAFEEKIKKLFLQDKIEITNNFNLGDIVSFKLNNNNYIGKIVLNVEGSNLLTIKTLDNKIFEVEAQNCFLAK